MPVVVPAVHHPPPRQVSTVPRLGPVTGGDEPLLDLGFQAALELGAEVPEPLVRARLALAVLGEEKTVLRIGPHEHDPIVAQRMLRVEHTALLRTVGRRVAQPVPVRCLGVVAGVVGAGEEAIRDHALHRRRDPWDRPVHHVPVAGPAAPLEDLPKPSGVRLRQAYQLLRCHVVIARPSQREVGVVLALAVVALAAVHRPVLGEHGSPPGRPAVGVEHAEDRVERGYHLPGAIISGPGQWGRGMRDEAVHLCLGRGGEERRPAGDGDGPATRAREPARELGQVAPVCGAGIHRGEGNHEPARCRAQSRWKGAPRREPPGVVQVVRLKLDEGPCPVPGGDRV